MRVIYIAGPYRAANDWETQSNIRRAEILAAYIWGRGAVAVCPHKNSAHLSGAAPEQVFIDGYRELVLRCDAVAVLPGWNKSSGTMAELEIATENNKPILSTKEDIDRFLVGIS